MYLKVNDVTTTDDYKLILQYSDGDIRIFDMEPYLDKGIFQQLKDKKVFDTVKPIFDSIEWENGADIDPEVLYENSVSYKPSIPIQS